MAAVEFRDQKGCYGEVDAIRRQHGAQDAARLRQYFAELLVRAMLRGDTFAAFEMESVRFSRSILRVVRRKNLPQPLSGER